jgi:hypothetical protein
MTMNCGSGPCTLACTGSNQTCDGTNLNCGTNACHVDPCPSQSLPKVDCKASCDCVDCK